jgi:FAR1 DNA-binding domain
VAININDENRLNDLMGVVVHNEEEAYSLYKNYALRVDFSIRKGHRKFFQGTKEVRMREYMCNKEGFKNDDSPSGKQYTKMVTRTDYEPCIRFTTKDGI